MASIVEKYRYLEVAAFACNARVRGIVEEKLYPELGHFFLYETFCADPITRDTDTENSKLFAPYLSRLIYNSRWIPTWDINNPPNDLTQVNFKTRSEKTIKDMKWYNPVEVSLKHSVLAKKLVNRWSLIRRRKYSIIESIHIPAKQTLELFKNTYDVCDEQERNSWVKIYALTGLPWVTLCGSEFKVSYFAIPIATKEVFYGFLMLALPSEKLKPKRNQRGQESDERHLPKKYRKFFQDDIINKLYLPTLVLFENSYSEKLFKKRLTKYQENKDIELTDDTWGELVSPEEEHNITFASAQIHSNCSGNSLCNNKDFLAVKLEHRLCELWSWRKAYFALKVKEINYTLESGDDENAQKKRQQALNKLIESLVFSTYFVASPGLVHCVSEIVEFNLRPRPDYLPSVLIVGGAGSGKDKMAKLVRILSNPRYAFGELHTINMAMLRPKAIAVPLLVGFKLSDDGKDPQWGGLFLQAKRDKNKIDLKGVSKEDQVKDINTLDTFILDELNSLDIDSQGVLLRILENAEVVSLGAQKGKDVHFLAIGIVNEKPENLTKDYIQDKLQNTKQLFGDIISELLSDRLHSARRLRGDLYHRLVRGGEIRIPELKDRRDDIPILFYFFCDGEKELEFKERETIGGSESNPSVVISLDAYEELIKTNYNWDGNIRELQTIAILAYKKYSNKSGNNIYINRDSIVKAFKDHARQLQSSGNVIKDMKYLEY